MGTNNIIEENISYNRHLGISYCIAIQTACDDFIKGIHKEGDFFIQEDYIKEKLNGIKYVNKRLRQLYKQRNSK